ncbi:MmcQ/YjbR family DNA-binding protein [Phocaeicola oris]|uniref:MmcQ/YjbR family DNA-binding protein n=1 Tax=Phocaeicola oris TaxID=2896850 RepID=UPI00234F35E8|nr:MmcQ/YjbR family DNA-binding protein [Phocaeicola oris]MCE2615324.1 MmcQ/YjbR family DNA-binding protein [Phocaeicola oris]
MDIEEVREYALTMPRVTEDLPFGPDVLTFRIGEKIFMAIGLDSEEPKITIKLEPDFAEELREHYDGVKPAFHWNKKHWSDIYLDHIDDELVKEWIKRSYDLVYSKLSRKIKETL